MAVRPIAQFPVPFKPLSPTLPSNYIHTGEAHGSPPLVSSQHSQRSHTPVRRASQNAADEAQAPPTNTTSLRESDRRARALVDVLGSRSGRCQPPNITRGVGPPQDVFEQQYMSERPWCGDDGMTVIDESTTADLVLTKLTSFGKLADRNGNLVGASRGDTLVIDEIRVPGVTLHPCDALPNEDPQFGTIPRVVVEVDMKYRTAVGLSDWCQKYLQLRQVRQVIGIKFYPRLSDGTFAALTIQFGRVRDENGGCEAITVVDAVSFGTADVHSSANLPQPISSSLRVLHSRVTQPDIDARRNPWPAGQRDPRALATGNDAFLYIPYTDAMHLGPGENDLLPDAVVDDDPADAAQDLLLQLFPILVKYAKADARVTRRLQDAAARGQ